MSLRPYQQAAIAAVRNEWSSGNRETLLVAATGAGKTQMFLELVMSALDADPAARALVVAHRRELIEQPLDRIRQMDASWLMRGPIDRPRVGMITQGHCDVDRQLTVATIQSLNARRLGQLLNGGRITHLVIDEAHHGTADSYLRMRQTLLDANPGLYHLGVTATPLRADGDGLSRVYTSVAARITIADLVQQGWLVLPRWLAVTTKISLANIHSRSGDYVQSELASAIETESFRQIVVKAYRDLARGRRFIAFTVSVDGAHQLAARFRADGLRVEAIDGTMDIGNRAQLLAQYRRGDLDGLTNCQVLTEGFDAPGTSCILMCRPTQSDSLYIQCMGRGLRPANGIAEPGEDCVILDFVPADARNIVMAGDVLGIPKETSAAIKEIVEEDVEPGSVQAGFTFDGHNFDTSGTPIEIVSRQLDYLRLSTLAWFPPRGTRESGDILTVNIGADNVGTERILVIRDGELYGIGRKLLGTNSNGTARHDKWRVVRIECDDPYVRAEEIARVYGDPQLLRRDRGWRQALITDRQVTYLQRMARGRLTLARMRLLSRGEANQWIARFVAIDAMEGLQ